MIFITLPGKGRRLKRCSNRFGGRAVERGLRDWFEFGDHQPMLNDRRLGRRNLAPVFEPEPTNGTIKAPAPRPLVFATCEDGWVNLIFDDGNVAVIDLGVYA